jgi:uncharacterized protein
MNINKIRERLKPPCKVIDFHVHPHSRLGCDIKIKPEENAKLILEAADRHGIDLIVLSDVGTGVNEQYPTPKQLVAINDHTLRARDVDGERFVAFAYLSPEYPEESLREMERCINVHGMKGIKLWIARKINDEGAMRLVECAVDFGVPILQHCFLKAIGNRPGETMPKDAVETARRFPNAKIILAHLNGIGLRGIEDIRSCPNISVDISGGDPQSLFVKIAVERLGVNRVIFGSDASRSRHFGTHLGKVLDENLSSEEIKKILWENAAKLLKINGEAK